MNPLRRIQLVNRIISGLTYFELNGQEYFIHSPNMPLLIKAEYFYDQIIEKHKYDGWLTEEQALRKLIETGIIESDYKKRLKLLQLKIENTKMELYECSTDPIKERKIRSRLKNFKRNLEDYEDRVNSLYGQTLEGYASACKLQYILIRTLKDGEDRLVFDENEEVPFMLLNNIMEVASKYSITVEEYRELARNDPWRQYWSIGKGNVFSKPIVECTDGQRLLAYFSKMYDSAYENPECPDDNVIEDDDKFDGWMLCQARDRKKKKEDVQEEKGMKVQHPGADEVFIMAEKSEDIKDINKLNTQHARIVKKQRQALIDKKGVVRESELPDRQQEIRMERNQAALKHARGKK